MFGPIGVRDAEMGESALDAMQCNAVFKLCIPEWDKVVRPVSSLGVGSWRHSLVK